MRTALTAVLLAGGAGTVLAHWGDGDPPPPRPRTLVTTRVEFYELDRHEINTYVRLAVSSADATPLRSHLHNLVAAGQASFIRSSAVTTNSGTRSASRSVVGRIYPTQFDPPEIPRSLAGPVSASVQFKTPVTPTSFEQRDVGHHLQLDLMNDSGLGSVSYRALSNKFITYLGEVPHGQQMSTIHQPVFYQISDTNEISQITGQWALLGIHTPPPAAPDTSTNRDRAVVTLVQSTNQIAGSPASNQAILNHWTALQEAPPPEPPDNTDPKKWFEIDPASEAPPAPKPPNISLLYEWFETDTTTALDLLDNHDAPHSDATALRNKLVTGLSDKSTRLLDHLVITTNSDKRTRTLSVRETIESIYSDPPEGPATLKGPIDPSVNIIANRTGGQTYETWEAGPKLEIGLDLNPLTSTVTVDLHARIITRLGVTHNALPPSDLPQPLYHEISDKTVLTTHAGLPVLVSMKPSIPDSAAGSDTLSPSRYVFSILTTRLLNP